MEIYLVDLIRSPELKDRELKGSELEGLLGSKVEKLIRVPEVNVPLYIGRSENADICVAADLSVEKTEDSKDSYDVSRKFLAYVSWIHALMVFKCNSVYAKDAGSLNGTFVNGHRVFDSWTKLRHGDRLTLNPYMFKVLIPEQYRFVDSDEGSITVDFPIKPEAGLGNTVEYQAEGE